MTNGELGARPIHHSSFFKCPLQKLPLSFRYELNPNFLGLITYIIDQGLINPCIVKERRQIKKYTFFNAIVLYINQIM